MPVILDNVYNTKNNNNNSIAVVETFILASTLVMVRYSIVALLVHE